MSSASGKYVLKGQACNHLWRKNRGSILGDVYMKYDPVGDVFLGEGVDEMGVEPTNHVDKEWYDVDIWNKDDGESYDARLGLNTHSEDVCDTSNATDVYLEFNWDDSNHPVTMVIFEEMVKRIEEYSKLDDSAKFIWVADTNVTRGGRRSPYESGLNIGVVG
jgi:hypothetical protein